MEQINWQRTRDILISLVCIGVIFWAAWTVLGQFVDAIVTLLLAMAVAFLLTPVVNFLGRRGLPRIIATLITYVIVVAAIVGLFYELVFSLVQQVLEFSNTISNFADSLPSILTSTKQALLQANIPSDRIQAAQNAIETQLQSIALAIPANIYTIGTNAMNVFITIFLIVVLSFYLTIDGKRIRDSLVSIAPKRWLPNVLLFEDALNRVVGNYIRGQLTLALIIGIFTGLICVITGLGSFALICGVLAFIFETIPMVGPGLASITPILLSLLLGGQGMWQRTLIIIGLFIVVQILESNILGPRIVGHAVGLHPVAAILSLLIGAKLFGVFGALLATPIVAAGWVVLASIYRSIRGESADQMLARKRAPWTIRRPNSQVTRGKREQSKDELRSRVHVDNRVDDQERIQQRTNTGTSTNDVEKGQSRTFQSSTIDPGRVGGRRTIDLARGYPRTVDQKDQ
jgi:predicted PurR-regulated permease PerM